MSHDSASRGPLEAGRHGALRRLARVGCALALAAALAAAGPAAADDYESDEAGHPLRVVAYVLHPVGVALDLLIFRPAHFLVSYEPLKTLFGHEDEFEELD